VVVVVDQEGDSTSNPVPGTLRYALEVMEGPRVVVFDFSGVISLQGRVFIRNPHITIAGQTAPGDGVVVRMAPNAPSGGPLIQVETHDVIIRYLQLRRGENNKPDNADNISVRDGADRVILDQMSLTWASDECVEFYALNEGKLLQNVTLQNSLVGEGLVEDSAQAQAMGMLISGNKTQGLELWKNVQQISVHRNLFVNNMHRNPRVAAYDVQIINNVIYNWHSRAGSTLRGAIIDWIQNMFKAGPYSNTTKPVLYHDSTGTSGEFAFEDTPSIYIDGNTAPGHPIEGSLEADNWNMIRDHYLPNNPPLPLEWRRDAPLAGPYFAVQLQDLDVELLRERVTHVGANARLNCDGTWKALFHDVDERLRGDVLLGLGPGSSSEMPTSVSELEGYSDDYVSKLCPDQDQDGMPDVWEDAHSLNKFVSLDSGLDLDGDGYTNLEEYLNGTPPSEISDDDHVQSLFMAYEGVGAGQIVAVPLPLRWATTGGSAVYFSEQTITVTARAAPGSVFHSWTKGPCSGSSEPSCLVTMSANKLVKARFD
jgi:pectate lyase